MKPTLGAVTSIALALALSLAGCQDAAPASPAGASARAPGGKSEVTLNGAGASFPAVLYSKWFAEYYEQTGVKVNYQSIGSGGGIKGISDLTVDFGASDAPMTEEQMSAAKGGAILHIPTAIGGVAVTYNVPGVTKQLRFTAESLAGVFLGDIKKWNDPLLTKDNPDAGLPDEDIVVVHRSDGSGTTAIFTDYLSTVSEKWQSSVGKGTSVNWPTGLGGKGNEGVANEVKQNPYSVGYVEVIYAIQQKLGVALVQNKAGQFVEPTLESVTAAAAGVADTIAPDLRASIVDVAGEGAYPISGFTWLLVYEQQSNAAKAAALAEMLWWAIHDGQRYNAELGYAPLPEAIVSKAEAKIRAITVDGKPAFAG